MQFWRSHQMCIRDSKWDLVKDKTVKVMKTFEDAIRNRVAPFVDFPIIFASALTKQRILKVLEEARDVYENRMTRIPVSYTHLDVYKRQAITSATLIDSYHQVMLGTLSRLPS